MPCGSKCFSSLAAPRRRTWTWHQYCPTKCSLIRLSAGEAGLVVAEMISQFELTAEPAKVREAIEDIASTYQDPEEVINWYYSENEQLAGIESRVLEDAVVESCCPPPLSQRWSAVIRMRWPRRDQRRRRNRQEKGMSMEQSGFDQDPQALGLVPMVIEQTSRGSDPLTSTHGS